jgi:protein-disulfide isomerase
MSEADGDPAGVRRRRYLAAVTAGLAAVAGCGGDGREGDTTPRTTASSAPTTTATSTGTEYDFTLNRTEDNSSGGANNDVDFGEKTTQGKTEVPQDLGEHPAGRSLGDQPVLGTFSEAEATIVAFEDPSCPVCRDFERTVVPKIRSNLVEPGKAVFAFRGYPVVYDWGEPAVHALEAAFDQALAAHWALLDHYFAEQDQFSSGNVVDRTREFLASETAIDAEAVATAAADRSQTAAVQSDLDAGMNAGASTITPHLFLFKEGNYLTSASGSVSYDLIAAALDF